MSEWVKTPPTEPGWYWWRGNDKKAEIAYVVLFTFDSSKQLRAYLSGLMGAKPVNEQRGEWWPVKLEEPTK